jgi:HlyD family secretion protein
LGNLKQAKVTVFVPEPSLSRVRLGQAALVSVDAYPGRTWRGTVTHIADHMEYTPRNIATQEGRQNTYFAVEVTVDNEELVLKPGMPANVLLQ